MGKEHIPMSKYTVGIDFGTLSARATLMDIYSGCEVSSASANYRHGVLSEKLPTGEELPEGFALQVGGDYVEAMAIAVRKAIESAGIPSGDIIGVGIDFTASTVIALGEDLEPLSDKEIFKSSPHAYVKLWKHHGAIREAEIINRVAKERGEGWLSRYGGKLSSEFMLPKVLETARCAPEVFDSAYCFSEAASYIVYKLTGRLRHSVCTNGFKAVWDERYGYPCDGFFEMLDPERGAQIKKKLPQDIISQNSVAGYVTKEAAKLTALPEGIPVAPALIDAHSALPATGVYSEGSMLMAIGTSSCHILVSEKEYPVLGISGYAKDALYCDLFVYEAGQSAVGDAFGWFRENALPVTLEKEATDRGLGVFQLLEEKAGKIKPTEDSPVALDWWNGCRAPYSDGGLKGCIMGLDITTAPEAIYRALIESTAYGVRRIVELYREGGIEVREAVAAGGIPKKNRLLVKIYADVLGIPIRISEATESCALGAAMLALAVANGEELERVSERLYDKGGELILPDPEASRTYDILYERYKRLSEFIYNESKH